MAWYTFDKLGRENAQKDDVDETKRKMDYYKELVINISLALVSLRQMEMIC